MNNEQKQTLVKTLEHGAEGSEIVVIDLSPDTALEMAESILKQHRHDREARIRFVVNADIKPENE